MLFELQLKFRQWPLTLSSLYIRHGGDNDPLTAYKPSLSYSDNGANWIILDDLHRRIVSNFLFPHLNRDVLNELRDDSCAPQTFPLCVKRRSLWDMNKDVLAALGGSDEAVTLWPREVLTHPLEHWTWMSAHRSADKDRKVWTFIQKAGVSLSRLTEERWCVQAQTNHKDLRWVGARAFGW